MTRLTKEEQEAIEWTRTHRATIESRNKIIIGIFIIAEIAFFAGYVNYYMLLPLAAGGTLSIPSNTFWLQQLFAEIGLVLPVWLINTKIIIKTYNVRNSDVATFAVAVAVLVTAAAVAAGTAVVAAAAVLAMTMTLSSDKLKLSSDNDD